MISLAGYVVIATLNGKQEIHNERVYKTPGECYVSLHWPKDEDDKAKYECFYIEGKPVKIEAKEIK